MVLDLLTFVLILYLIWVLARPKIKINFTNKKAILITGCDSGFGYATSLRLRDEGFIVYAGCLTQGGVDRLSNESVKNGAKIMPLLLDVTSELSIQKALDVVKKEQGNNLWAIVNNAGIYKIGMVDVLSMKDWEQTYDVNVLGIVRMVRAFWPLLHKTKGRIVNIASVLGHHAPGYHSAYASSKFAVVGLSDSLRQDLSDWGVKVIVIEPGAIRTDLYKNTFGEENLKSTWESLPQPQKDFYGYSYLKKCQDHAEFALNFISKILGGNPSVVAEGIVDAVTTKWPKSHYWVGRDTPLWSFLIWMPYCFTDFIFKTTAKFPKIV